MIVEELLGAAQHAMSTKDSEAAGYFLRLARTVNHAWNQVLAGDIPDLARDLVAHQLGVKESGSA